MSPRAPRTRAEAKTARRKSTSGTTGRRWPRRLLYAFLALLGLGVAAVALSFALIKVPPPNEIATAETSMIYYSDGKTLMDSIAEVDRRPVELSKVSEPMRQAIVSAEDRTFYENEGISPRGIARAVSVAVKGGEATQGASTITQQYVRNYFLSQDRTVSRKYKEMVIAIKLDGELSKDQILENYLNTIYFGRGSYGVETAARNYYRKPASKLTAAEAAVLTSVIRGPSLYDPMLGKDKEQNLRERWGLVMDQMVRDGHLTEQQRADAKFPMPWTKWKPRTSGGTNAYITELVKDELRNKVKLTDAEIAGGGLKVVTTIQAPKQKAMVESVKDGMPEGAEGLHVGMASIVPGDGAVVALYGGEDFAKEQFNSATDATIQAGSTFKIFTLIAALQSGDVNIRNTFSGASPQFFDEFKNPGAGDDFNRRGGVRNFGNSSFGTMSVRSATASSVNTIYARLNLIATPKATAAAARAAGVTTPVQANYGNVFGTDNVHVLDMANAYATIAAGGERATPYFVRAVSTSDGKLDYKVTVEKTRVFDKDLSADVIDSMRAVVQEGSGSYAQNIGRPAAGKTGTTSDNYGAWFDGYVPQLATAVGIYRGDGSLVEKNRMNNVPGVGELTGGSVPVRIWTDYMTQALEGTDVEQFPEPAYINPNANPYAKRGGGGSPPPATRAPQQQPTRGWTPDPTAEPTPSDSGTPTPQESPTQGTPTQEQPPPTQQTPPGQQETPPGQTPSGTGGTGGGGNGGGGGNDGGGRGGASPTAGGRSASATAGGG